MSFHTNGPYRHEIFLTLCDTIRDLAHDVGLRDSDGLAPHLPAPIFTVVAYSMGSSIATEFLTEFFHHMSLEGMFKESSYFKVYEARLGFAGCRLILYGLRTHYTLGSPIAWQFPHRPPVRV